MRDMFNHVYELREGGAWVQAIFIFIFFIFLCLVFVNVRSMLFGGMKLLFYSNKEGFHKFLLQFAKPSLRLRSIFFVLMVLNIFIGVSYFLTRIHGDLGIFDTIAVNASVYLLAVFIFQYLIFELCLFAFLSKPQSSLLRLLHRLLWMQTVFFCSFFSFLALSASVHSLGSWLYVVLACFIVWCLVVIYLGLVRILESGFSFGHLILYLCAVEIVPLYWYFVDIVRVG